MKLDTHVFTVMPADTNYMYPMVFGGKVLAEMDIAAAQRVRSLLNENHSHLCAVTVAVDKVTFFAGAEVGDIVILKSHILRMGIKSIKIKVEGVRQCKGSSESYKLCTGEFTFVTKNHSTDDKGTSHGLS